VAAYQPV